MLGHPFVLLKLRTMRTAADGAEHAPAFPDAGGLTRSGRVLRLLSLDELPSAGQRGPRRHEPGRAAAHAGLPGAPL